jgi:hypothetical protein
MDQRYDARAFPITFPTAIALTVGIAGVFGNLAIAVVVPLLMAFSCGRRTPKRCDRIENLREVWSE